MRVHPYEPKTAIITSPEDHASVKEWMEANGLVYSDQNMGGVEFRKGDFDRVLFEREYQQERDGN